MNTNRAFCNPGLLGEYCRPIEVPTKAQFAAMRETCKSLSLNGPGGPRLQKFQTGGRGCFHVRANPRPRSCRMEPEKGKSSSKVLTINDLQLNCLTSGHVRAGAPPRTGHSVSASPPASYELMLHNISYHSLDRGKRLSRCSSTGSWYQAEPGRGFGHWVCGRPLCSAK